MVSQRGALVTRVLGRVAWARSLASVLVVLAFMGCEDETVDAVNAVDMGGDGMDVGGADEPRDVSPGPMCPGSRICADDYPCPEGFECLDGCCEVMTECARNRPCPSGQICTIDGVCVTQLRQCGEEMGCPEGQVCNDAGACRSAPAPDPECDENSPCPEGQACDDAGVCVAAEAPDCCAPTPDCCLDDVGPPIPLITCADLECGAFEECVPGEGVDARCQLIECVEDTDCNSEDHFCDEGACVDDICVPGSLRCADGGIEMCVENGAGFERQRRCGSDSPAVESDCADDGIVGAGCTCRDFRDCPAEEGCVLGRCVPLVPQCERPAVDLMASEPSIEFQWAHTEETPRPFGGSYLMLATPVVANLDDDNQDGVVDHRDYPEVVFVTRTSEAVNRNAKRQNGVLRAVRAAGPNRGEDLFAAMGERVWRAGDPLPDPESYPESMSPGFIHPMATVAVADLDDPTLTDGHPEIVTYTEGHQVAIFSPRGNLLARTETGAFSNVDVYGSTSTYLSPAVTVANLDGRGMAEIILGRVVLTLERDDFGELHFRDVFKGTLRSGAADYGPIPCVGDVWGDADLEVVAGGTVYGLPRRPQGARRPADCVENGGRIEPADAEEDAFCQGALAVRWDTRSVNEDEASNGFCAIADVMGPGEDLPGLAHPLDGRPEVIIAASSGRLEIHDGETGVRRMSVQHGLGEWGGVPQVADFDGDGFPEIGLANRSAYAMIDLQESRARCPQWNEEISDRTPRPLDNRRRAPGGPLCQRDRDCAVGTGVCHLTLGQCVCLHNGWTYEIEGGANLGASLFDFDGDGDSEVVVRDQCWLRILDGATGALLVRRPVSNKVRYGRPLVVDLDQDGSAEIVYSASESGENCPLGPQRLENGSTVGASYAEGVFVLGERNGLWGPARPVWNQLMYSPGHILPDGSIPPTVPGGDISPAFAVVGAQTRPPGTGADLTVLHGRVTPIEGGCGALGEAVRITVTVRNEGDVVVSGEVPVVFEALSEEGETTPLAGPDGQALTAPLGVALWPGAATVVSVVYDAMASPFGEDGLPAQVRVTADPVGAPRAPGEPPIVPLLSEQPPTPPPSADPDVFANVPEAAAYELLYTLDIPVSANLSVGDIYAVNNMPDWEGEIDRVAYYLTLSAEGSERVFVFASGRAWTQDVNQLGIPRGGVTAQGAFEDLQVISNLPLVEETEGANGWLEIWSNGYGVANGAGVPGARDDIYDFGDTPDPDEPTGYGCFQVHNLDTPQVVFGYTDFNRADEGGIGIGPNLKPYHRDGLYHSDWTWIDTTQLYEQRLLQVLVRRARAEEAGEGVDDDDAPADAGLDAALAVPADAAVDGAPADGAVLADAGALDGGGDAGGDAADASAVDAAPAPPPPRPARAATGPYGAVPECDEDDNSLVLDVVDPDPLADLRLSDFVAEGGRCPVGRLSVTVSNGGENAVEGAVLRFFAGDPVEGGRLLFEDRLPGPIEAGASHPYVAEVPAFLPFRPLRIYAQVSAVDGGADCAPHDNRVVAPGPLLCRFR